MYRGSLLCHHHHEKESATLRAKPGKLMAALTKARHTTSVSLYGREDAIEGGALAPTNPSNSEGFAGCSQRRTAVMADIVHGSGLTVTAVSFPRPLIRQNDRHPAAMPGTIRAGKGVGAPYP